MIKQSSYLPKQMNGPVVNSVMAALEEQLEDADTIIDYLHNLTILNAQDTELDSIGCIIGYPRPLVPEGFISENLLILTDLPQTVDASIGLGSIYSEIGGLLSTTTPSDNNYMSTGLYKQFLDKVAFIKRYGITLYSVDAIASLISDDYEISWDEYADIVVTFANNIGYKNVWVLTQLFYRLATSPQVKIVSGS